MIINIFVLKGDLNEKIVLVCFFFCRVYLSIHLCHSIKNQYCVMKTPDLSPVKEMDLKINKIVSFSCQ